MMDKEKPGVAGSAATRRGVISAFGGLAGASVVAGGEALAADDAANGEAIVPLVPAVGSVFAGLPLKCLGFPEVKVERTAGSARISAHYDGEFVASLRLDDGTISLTTPGGEFDCVIRITRPNPNTILYALTAFDPELGAPSSLRIRGRIDAAGVEHISIRVNLEEIAEFTTSDSEDRILDEFAKVRTALSATSLPFNLLALNTFAAWAPAIDEFPSYIVNLHLLTATAGMPVALAPAAHQQPGDSPLGRWLACLMACCADCGGCWDDNGLFGHVGCHRCRGTGILRGLKEATCYNLCVILCVPDAVVSPLKP